MERFDVVVVGAGLAGLQCSRLLGRGGLAVLLVDRKDDPSRPVHTTGIFVRRTLEDFDLPASLLGPAVRRVGLHSPSGLSITLTAARDEFRIGRMGAIYRHFLDEAISEGVVVRPATVLASIERRSGSSIVRLRGGSRDVATRFVVGADGTRSRVAAFLGLDRNHDMLVGLEDVYRRRTPGGQPRFECLIHPRIAPGYVGWIADDGQEIHIGVAGQRERIEAARSLEAVRNWAGRVMSLEGLDQVERRGGLIPVGGVLRRIACDHGLLVGDAAGAASPLTAGGLDAAMRLSAVAANSITRAIAARDPLALREYAGRRFRARFASRIGMRRLFAALVHPLLVDLAFGGLQTLPGLLLARHIFFGRGSFPDITLSRPVGRMLEEI